MKKLSKITESIWSDIQDRSSGDTVRKEDDINLMSIEDFCAYLNDNYISEDDYRTYRIYYVSKVLSIAVLMDGSANFYSIKYDYGHNMIYLNDEIEDCVPELCQKLKNNFKVVKNRVSSIYTKFIIYPSDGSECTNRFFVDVLDFIIKNGDKKRVILTKQNLNESIWSDIQDRSSGDTIRKEDIITTNEDLKNKIKELYIEQGEGETLDVSSLTNIIKCDDFSNIFEEYRRVKHIIGLEDWDVSNVKNMRDMFFDCVSFNSDLSNWDVRSVEDMDGMFFGCINFNSDLSNWDVSSVKDMRAMFYDCKKFNCDLSNWDVRKVENMRIMFWDCQTFNSDLSNWDVSNVNNMKNMFDGCESLKQIPSWYKNK